MAAAGSAIQKSENRERGGKLMKISTKGRYALRVMLDLAVNNTGEYIPLKEVAVRQEITL